MVLAIEEGGRASVSRTPRRWRARSRRRRRRTCAEPEAGDGFGLTLGEAVKAGPATTASGETSMTDGNRHAFELRPGMRRGISSAVPLRHDSSRTRISADPTDARSVPGRGTILGEAARLAPRLGLSRREFLSRSGGMAASLLAMNAVFGHFFDVLPVEAADPAAFQERTGPPDLHLRRAAALRQRRLRPE